MERLSSSSSSSDAGSDVVSSVYFDLIHRDHKLEIRHRRAEWCLSWTQKKACERTHREVLKKARAG